MNVINSLRLLFSRSSDPTIRGLIRFSKDGHSRASQFSQSEENGLNNADAECDPTAEILPADLPCVAISKENTTHPSASNDTAVVFIHGLFGPASNPENLHEVNYTNHGSFKKKGWSIYSYQYKSDPLCDKRGNLKDPSLEEISDHFITTLQNTAKRHKNIFLVGHSMGGLIAQRAVTKSDELNGKVSGIFLCGTPSNGVPLSRFPHGVFHRQVRDLRSGGNFIKTLRNAWDAKYKTPEGTYKFPFLLRTIAGEHDTTVPFSSSLDPFPEETWGICEHDHSGVLHYSLPAIALCIQGHLTGWKLPMLIQPLPHPSVSDSFEKNSSKAVASTSSENQERTLSVPYIKKTPTTPQNTLINPPMPLVSDNSSSSSSQNSQMIITEKITDEPDSIIRNPIRNIEPTKFHALPAQLKPTFSKRDDDLFWKESFPVFLDSAKRPFKRACTIKAVKKKHLILRSSTREVVPNGERKYKTITFKYPISNIWPTVHRNTMERAMRAGNTIEIDESSFRKSEVHNYRAGPDAPHKLSPIKVRFFSDTWRHNYKEPLTGTFTYDPPSKRFPQAFAYHTLKDDGRKIRIPTEELLCDARLSLRQLIEANGKEVSIAFQAGRISFTNHSQEQKRTSKCALKSCFR